MHKLRRRWGGGGGIPITAPDAKPNTNLATAVDSPQTPAFPTPSPEPVPFVAPVPSEPPLPPPPFEIVPRDGYTLKIGDIVFSDNTVLPYNSRYTDEQWATLDRTKVPVAVIFRGGENALGMGLKKDTRFGDAVWARTDTVGYNFDFKSIVCRGRPVYIDEKPVLEFFPTDDLDGSDNRAQICEEIQNSTDLTPEQKQEGTDISNYPLFEECLYYGTRHGFDGTEFCNGRYIPTAAELYWASENADILDSVFERISGVKVKNVRHSTSSTMFFNDPEKQHMRIAFHIADEVSFWEHNRSPFTNYGQALRDTPGGYIRFIRAF